MLALADRELDNGPRSETSATKRMCAVSRKVRGIDELIRFVVAPSGEVIADVKRKLPGRGLWVFASRQAVLQAVRSHQFERGFKRDVRVSPALAADTEALLGRAVIEALAIAAKAGQVLCGFSKVQAALKGNTVKALIHASDGAADGIRKLNALLGQTAGINDETARIPIVSVLTSAELDLALTRSNVIHAALLAGRAGKTFLSRSEILHRYRLADAGTAAGTAARQL